MSETIIPDQWHGCYDASWKTGSAISSASFQHPAKISRALVQRMAISMRRVLLLGVFPGWSDSVTKCNPFEGNAMATTLAELIANPECPIGIINDKAFEDGLDEGLAAAIEALFWENNTFRKTIKDRDEQDRKDPIATVKIGEAEPRFRHGCKLSVSVTFNADAAAYRVLDESKGNFYNLSSMVKLFSTDICYKLEKALIEYMQKKGMA